jgi:hypothetical protein
MGVGVVIRDAQGNVVAALAKTTLVSRIRKWLRRWGLGRRYHCARERVIYSQVVLEGDALNVIKAIQQIPPCWAPWGQLIEDTRTRLHGITQFQLQHIRREANHAAHSLAKWAVNQLCDCMWVGECPPQLLDVILAEQAF